MALTDITSFAAHIYKDILANATAEAIPTMTTLYGVEIDNTANVVAVFVKAWTASPSVGTDDPAYIWYCPASSRVTYMANDGVGQSVGGGLWIAGVLTGGTAGTGSPTNPVKVQVATS